MSNDNTCTQFQSIEDGDSDDSYEDAMSTMSTFNEGFQRLPEELIDMIYDAVFEDAAIVQARKQSCGQPQKHWDLMRLAPGSDTISSLSLVSRRSRERVMKRRYGSIEFYGGGAGCEDGWELFESHMIGKVGTVDVGAVEAINVDTENGLVDMTVLLGDNPERTRKSRLIKNSSPSLRPLDHVKSITVKSSIYNKYYAERILHLANHCPDLRTLEISYLHCCQFFDPDRKISDTVPSSVKELVCVAYGSSTTISGLAGRVSDMFTHVGVIKNRALPHWRELEFRGIQRLTIIPYLKPPNTLGLIRLNERPSGELYNWKFPVAEDTANWNNLANIAEMALDLTELHAFPFPITALESFVNMRYNYRSVTHNAIQTGIHNVDVDDEVAGNGIKQWALGRYHHASIWSQMGLTPKLPYLKGGFEIDVTLDPFIKGEMKTHDYWYWLRLWLQRLQVKCKTLTIRIHLLSPGEYFSHHRATTTPERSKDRDHPPFESGWMNHAIPSDEDVLRFAREIQKFHICQDVVVKLVRKRWQHHQEKVLLRKWEVRMKAENGSPYFLDSLCYRTNAYQFVMLADEYNTWEWSRRLEWKLHEIPRDMVGMF